MTILLASDFGAEERQAWQAAVAQCLPGERLVLERAARTDAGIDVAFVAIRRRASSRACPG